jgi:hypothetical protein
MKASYDVKMRGTALREAAERLHPKKVVEIKAAWAQAWKELSTASREGEILYIHYDPKYPTRVIPSATYKGSITDSWVRRS